MKIADGRQDKPKATKKEEEAKRRSERS